VRGGGYTKRKPAVVRVVMCVCVCVPVCARARVCVCVCVCARRKPFDILLLFAFSDFCLRRLCVWRTSAAACQFDVTRLRRTNRISLSRSLRSLCSLSLSLTHTLSLFPSLPLFSVLRSLAPSSLSLSVCVCGVCVCVCGVCVCVCARVYIQWKPATHRL
jgi:hypothetical protein